MQNKVDIPIPCQQAALAHHLLALLRTVTAGVPVLRPCSERCTMKQVFWLVEPMWNRGISPQINQYDQGRKVCRLKRLCWKTHNLWGHRPAKPDESVKYHYVKPSSPHLSLFHRYKYRNLNFLLSPLFLPVYFHIVPHLAGILQSNKTHLAIDEIVLPIV